MNPSTDNEKEQGSEQVSPYEHVCDKLAILEHNRGYTGIRVRRLIGKEGAQWMARL